MSMLRFLSSLLLIASLMAGTVQAALLDVGPVVPEVVGSSEPNLGHGFPLWYRDTNRVPLQLCTDRASGMCATFEPFPNQPLNFPDNMSDELFWWSAAATMVVPVQGALTRAGDALLDMAIEAAFSTGDVAPGAQVSFARIRVRVDTPYAGEYVVTTPYKQLTFNVAADAIADGINHTEDIGIAEGGVFTGALAGNVGPFLYCTNAPIVVNGKSYVGDPGTDCAVLGSTFPSKQNPSNFFRIQGPNSFDLQTDQFSVSGMLYADTIATPLEVDKVAYSRTSAGVQVNAFATTQALSNQRDQLAAFPLNFALTNAPSTLQISGADLTTQDMATNTPGDGAFFSASGLFTLTAALPAEVTVTNSADVPVTARSVPLVDEVVVERCYYNADNKTLSVKASSLDALGQPALQLFMPGREAALGTLNAGWLHIGFPFTDNGPPAKTYAIPPRSVTVKSALGGSATAPVSIYVPQFFTVTATAGPNGTISPAGATSVELGASQSFTITPNTGYTVQALVVDGVTLAGATSYTFENVSANHYINAYFAPLGFTITASAGNNGSVTPAGEVAVSFGSSRSFTFTPDPGFAVAELVVDGQTLPAASYYTFSNISADHTISANFAAGSFTIRAAAGANGSISPDGVSAVAGGTTQSYTITPEAGYRVAALVVDGVTLAGAASYSFENVSANHYINAYFEPDGGFTIRAAAAVNGSITPAGATVAAAGSTQSYTITPNEGYRVAALVVDGVTLAGATSYSFENVSANHYINAYFAPAGGFTIRAAAGANGSITPAGATVVTAGAEQSYSITPNDGYQVSALVVDGEVLPGATSHTFTGVTAEHYINAYFSRLP